jgi:hypothetical protein
MNRSLSRTEDQPGSHEYISTLEIVGMCILVRLGGRRSEARHGVRWRNEPWFNVLNLLSIGVVCTAIPLLLKPQEVQSLHERSCASSVSQ